MKYWGEYWDTHGCKYQDTHCCILGVALFCIVATPSPMATPIAISALGKPESWISIICFQNLNSCECGIYAGIYAGTKEENCAETAGKLRPFKPAKMDSID
jgi:hypothetical protein